MTNIIESIAYLKARLADTDGGFLTDVEVDRGHLRTVVESLEKVVKEVAFKVGDVVREVGESEPTGEVIQVTEGPHEKGYLVKLYNPPRTANFKAITYYEDEMELIERKI